MALHGVILMVGCATYTDMPLIDWLRDTIELARNHADPVGHVAQEFFPTSVVHEILVCT